MGPSIAVAAATWAMVVQLHLGAVTAPDAEARRADLVARLERSAVMLHARMPPRSEGGVEIAGRVSMGAGAVLRGDGLVVTAAHVVVGAAEVAVKVEDEEPVPARVVFLDVASDVALLRFDAKPGLVPAQLGDSDHVRKGETVYVIGTPSGFERSLSVGVVSGRHPLGHVVGGDIEVEVIQTDAAVNPGNSGGPIFDSRGRLIAIAQVIVSRGGGSNGLGFGLAVNVLKKLLALDPCTWLGFSGIPLSASMANALNVPRSGGVLVQVVTPGSPAAEAGIVAGNLPVRVAEEQVLLGGDVVLEANGIPILEWVRTRLTGGTPGERHEYRLLVLRAGRLLEVPVVAVHRAWW